MSVNKKDSKLWETLSREAVYTDLPWIQLWKEAVRLPNQRVIDNFYQLDMRDFSMVIATTPDDKFVMVRLYKHGTRRVSLMFPGGAIEANETPLNAAQRELLEETGYAADRWEPMGKFIQDSNHYHCTAHFFIASGARKVTEPVVSDEEDAEVVLLKKEKAIEALRQGEVVSLTVMSGILMALNPSIMGRTSDPVES